MALMHSLTADTTQTDAKAFIGFLDQQATVDVKRKVVVEHYGSQIEAMYAGKSAPS